MKILFLDLKVLDSEQSRLMHERLSIPRPSFYHYQFCPQALFNLSYLLDHIPDGKVVISSPWKLGEDLNFHQKLFEHLKLPVYSLFGSTPNLSNLGTAREIESWFLWHKNIEAKEFLIIDQQKELSLFQEHLIAPDPLVGFSLAEVKKIFSYFNASQSHNSKVIAPF